MSVGDVKESDLKAVSYCKDGTVRVFHDGTLHTLRRIRHGQYKRLRDEFKEIGPLDQERVDLSNQAQKAEGAEQAQIVQKLLALSDEFAERKAHILTLIFNGHPGQDGVAADPVSGDPGRPEILPFKALADIPLPADVDEGWEEWLLSDEELLAKLMEHWRQVPLVRGAPASD